MSTLNLKKETKPGVCAAMRCTVATTPADTVGLVRDEDACRVELCGKHYGLAIAAYGPRCVVREAPADGAVAVIATPDASTSLDTNEPAALAAEAGEALELARTYEIASQADLDFAAEVLVDAKARAKYVQERKEAITKPLNAALKAARDLFRPAERAFAEVEVTFKNAIASFHERQAAHNGAALALAAEAHAAGDAAGTSEALASMASTAQVQGVGVRYTFGFEIADPDAVERAMCTPDSTKIREYMRDAVAQCRDAGVPDEDIAATITIPGVTFTRAAGVAVRA